MTSVAGSTASLEVTCTMAEATRRQVIHYYRRILGLAELFPDPVGACGVKLSFRSLKTYILPLCSLAIRVRCREQFRRHVAETDPLRIARHIADARKVCNEPCREPLFTCVCFF